MISFDDVLALRASRLHLLARTFRFDDDRQNAIAFASIRDYRVLASIDLFAGRGMQQPLLWIREHPGSPPRFDLFDPSGGHRIGALRQRPWKSLFLDEWTIHDPSLTEIGCVRQRSPVQSFVHHFLLFVPTRYDFYLYGDKIGTCRQNANPLMPRMTFDFKADPEKRLDRRVAAAAAILLLEYRKHDE
jgi:hypothetical protein